MSQDARHPPFALYPPFALRYRRALATGTRASIAALIKRWILGMHHGSVQPAHLDAYLDEFVFRFNRRPSASRGMLF